MVEVIPRSVWGARHDNGGGSAPVPFTEWWLHHSVTIAPDLVPPFDDEYAAMRALEDIGQQRFNQGISYTWPIMPNGRVYEGHGVDRLGAHTGGRNSRARAICFVGNYDVAEVTPQQIEAAAQLMVQEYRAGRATRYTLNGGHRQLKATSCPGDNGFAAIPVINARAVALIGGATPVNLEDDMSAAAEAAIFDMQRKLSQNNDKDWRVGDAVGDVQRVVRTLHRDFGWALAQLMNRDDVDEAKVADAILAGIRSEVSSAVQAGGQADLSAVDADAIGDVVEARVRALFSSLGKPA